MSEEMEEGQEAVSRILIVEDDAEVREFLRFELEEEYAVLEAENGQAGLELALEHQPDLMVVDVMMPVLDGIELCRRIKTGEETSHIAVIMLTARDEERDQLAGLESGANDYVTKPFSVPVLKARIRNQLEAHRRMRERFSREIIPVEPSELTNTSTDEAFLQRAIAVVEEHLDDFDFTVDDFVAQMHVSRTALFSKLKALVGQNLQEFIRTLRLKRGAELLKGTTDSISEIAARVGFLEPTNFSRSFKSQFGVSPSDYRES